MTKCRTTVSALATALLLAAGPASGQVVAERSAAETEPPFGGPENVAYAGALWLALVDARLAGGERLLAKPYAGREPHGSVLVLLEGTVEAGGHKGLAIVKRNYLAEGLTVGDVANDPSGNLDSVTVMFRREAGYDPDTLNWFWAKYGPEGELATTPDGTPLAGRVAKGAAEGCIACHAEAPGGDYVFSHDRVAGQ